MRVEDILSRRRLAFLLGEHAVRGPFTGDPSLGNWTGLEGPKRGEAANP
ncbi:MAG TPA: hypothetical protein VMW71_03675 [Thermoplasmata archaeon]|nr:hypothetical protein [Thermoplasmata archaeon]